MNDARQKYVAFADENIKKTFDKLEHGRFEDKEMHKHINRAIQDIKTNPFIGINIPRRLWPKEYVQKYNINNLRKYDLPDGWRLLYTIKGNQIKIVSIILEWMDHTNYNQKFKY